MFTSQQHSFCLIYAYVVSLLSIFIALILFNKILNPQGYTAMTRTFAILSILSKFSALLSTK